jgi:hypothetical protein
MRNFAGGGVIGECGRVVPGRVFRVMWQGWLAVRMDGVTNLGP